MSRGCHHSHRHLQLAAVVVVVVVVVAVAHQGAAEAAHLAAGVAPPQVGEVQCCLSPLLTTVSTVNPRTQVFGLNYSDPSIGTIIPEEERSTVQHDVRLQTDTTGEAEQSLK
jgi:hypothetical protein